MRSHPPSIPTLVRRVLERTASIRSGESTLVAVSGGPDSMALLHVLARMRRARGFRLFAHGVDHGLRAEASIELDIAQRFAESLEVPFARTVVAVVPGGNLQARARQARYEALRRAKESLEASSIATAHHADDRAETVLIRLLRGAGPRGLAVLPPVSGDLIRPFFYVRRTDIAAYVARHNIPSSSDPSNTSSRFLRTRVRHELLPLLAQLNPGIVEHLCALADQMAAFPPSTLPDGFLTLPRRTQEALGELATKSKRARVPLPGGLVAALDATQAGVVVLPGSPESDKFRARAKNSRPPFEENGHHKETPFTDPLRGPRVVRERSFT